MADIFLRRDINGITPMDIKYMNDNFKYMWLKVFGNITTGDLMDGAITEDKVKNGAITADKIAANAITAEKIEAGSITALQIDTSTLVVGTNIQMGANATIGWDKVTSKPNDLVYTQQLTNTLTNYVTNLNLSQQLNNYATVQALQGYVQNGTLSTKLYDLLNNSNLNTLIGQDFLITGKIAANQIAAGNISGCTIQTANASNYIVLENQYLEIYNGYTPYARLAYDTGYDGYYRSYLQLNNAWIVNSGSYIDVSVYGTNQLSIGGGGIQTNGINCTSISTTNNVSIDGSLTVYGTKNATVKTADYGLQVLSADESPDVIFSDRSFAVIGEDGTCTISLEPIFKQTIYIGDSEYHVFLQGLGDDVKLVDKQNDSFTVSGKKDTKFSWKVEAYRLGYEHKRFNEMSDWETFRKEEEQKKKNYKEKHK